MKVACLIALTAALTAALTTGCTTPRQMHANLSGDARLDFEVNGCLVDKARLTVPKSQEKKGRHWMLVKDKDGNTVARYVIDCQPDGSGSPTNCLTWRDFLSQEGFACNKFHSFEIRHY